MAGGLPADRSYNKHTVYFHIKIKLGKIMVKAHTYTNCADQLEELLFLGIFHSSPS